MKHAAIPTVYRGIQFRSRLEAKWAWIFDRLGWQWEYEPIDLNGWIPDFVIQGEKPILVDVKPIFVFDEGIAHKIQKATGKDFGTKYDCLILAAGLVKSPQNDCFAVGWINDDFGGGTNDDWDLAVILHPYAKPELYGLSAQYGSYHDRITGFGDGDHGYKPLYEGYIGELWSEATNASQWKAPQ